MKASRTYEYASTIFIAIFEMLPILKLNIWLSTEGH